MNVLITGAEGFIARNLRLGLAPRNDIYVLTFTRDDPVHSLNEAVREADFVVHLAGVNRPTDPAEFGRGNADLTRYLCDAVANESKKRERVVSILFASSTQASRDNPYGLSKRAAEEAVFELERNYGVPCYVLRLPNVFGKWCRPNYNSVVATFCHNIARGLPIRVDDPEAGLTLAYVDDVVKAIIAVLDGKTLNQDPNGFLLAEPMYSATVGELAQLIKSFSESRKSLLSGRVGSGLPRALYSTYVSYLPPNLFSYSLPMHRDPRGTFVEMLKTQDSGQFSYFTAHPGVTRGGHYHHSKTEKFLVICGRARFRFRHMTTGETYELETNGEVAEIVETVPGWTHDITNIGKDELVVMLWANEVFDPALPDTYACPV